MRNPAAFPKLSPAAVVRARQSYEAAFLSVLARCLEAGGIPSCEAQERARTMRAQMEGGCR